MVGWATCCPKFEFISWNHHFSLKPPVSPRLSLLHVSRWHNDSLTQRCPCPNSHDQWICYYIGKRDFADMIKKLEMGRSSWVIWVTRVHRWEREVEGEGQSEPVWKGFDSPLLASKMEEGFLPEILYIATVLKFFSAVYPFDSLVLPMGPSQNFFKCIKSNT